MRHFGFLTPQQVDEVFHLAPQDFDLAAERRLLAVALGATLYLPATRPDLVRDLARAHRRGVVSAVVCLEDSIPDDQVETGQANTVEALRRLAGPDEHSPMVFVRVRHLDQVEQIVEALGEESAALAGFVLPKFSPGPGAQALTAVAKASSHVGRRLWAMPVLESAEVMHTETRLETLLAIRRTLAAERDSVLAVRIGATDLSSVFGLRRPRGLTVYDVHPLAGAIADIVNIMARQDGTGYVVTGPVWEYFGAAERMFKPQLRTTPFLAHDEGELRARLVAKDQDALIRELVLDRANGLTGKTVIHPSHVAAVHALSVVTHEEWVDARDVLAATNGGVSASDYRNKMNEAAPHRAWAEQIRLRAQVFGVAREDVSFVDLLGVTVIDE